MQPLEGAALKMRRLSQHTVITSKIVLNRYCNSGDYSNLNYSKSEGWCSLLFKIYSWHSQTVHRCLRLVTTIPHVQLNYSCLTDVHTNDKLYMIKCRILMFDYASTVDMVQKQYFLQEVYFCCLVSLFQYFRITGFFLTVNVHVHICFQILLLLQMANSRQACRQIISRFNVMSSNVSKK